MADTRHAAARRGSVMALALLRCMSHADVIVIGGGAAGIAATRDLSATGVKVLLLEARERLGGRIHTVHEPTLAMPIELGAEFVHGEAEEIFRLVESSAMLIDRLPDVHWWSERGKLRERRDFWPRVTKILARAGKLKRDVPFEEFLAKVRLSPADRKLVSQFVEGYHAADLKKVSSQSLVENDGEQDEDDNPQFRVVGGYDALLALISAGFDRDNVEIRTSSEVTGIGWKKNEVAVTARSVIGGEVTHRARAAIVTLPVGVLRSRVVSWDPQPRGVDAALEKLEMGDVCKIVFRFRARFWEEKEFLEARIVRGSTRALNMNFLHGAADFPTWWTYTPAMVPMMTAWCGGPRAASLLELDEGKRIDRALESLSMLLAMPRSELDDLVAGWWTHDWRADPFSRGAYSYALVGGAGARKKIARPIDATLFFAGEACDEEQSGTVAGAIATGRKAAAAIISALGR